ncbi:MAG: FtsK/SpoIIIE domain-containing protein [Chloroflexota bacterium]
MPEIETSLPDAENAHFNRPPRIQRALPQCEIELPAPPVPTPPPTRGLLTALLPSLGMLLSMGVMSVLSYQQSRNALAMLPTGIMAVVSMTSAVMMFREQFQSHAKQMVQQVERFKAILQFKMHELEDVRKEETRLRLENDPPLERILWMIEEDDLRLWERRTQDPDFACVRIGVGETTPAARLILPKMDPLAPHYEEVSAIYAQNRTIKDVPITINLRRAGSFAVWGSNRALVLENIYAMLAHLITHHAPHELRIALLCAPERANDWDWLKWVRHNESLQPDLPGRSVAIGKEAARTLMNDLTNLVRPRLSDEGQDRPRPGEQPVYPVHYLLIIDHFNLVKDDAVADYLLNNARLAGLTVLDIESSPRDVPDVCQARLEISPIGRAEFATVGPDPIICQAQIDRLGAHQASELARQLTNKHQARGTTTVSNIPTSVRLIDALFASDSQKHISVDDVDIRRAWAGRAEPYTWGILLGWKQNNEPVWLNLLEDQDGPHGLAAGTTGAGKSILLQSMILSLALTHSPEEINFVLIDFKGGSTAEAFRDLPHTISVITNLQGRLVDRSLDILKAEARRRQEVLRQVGVKDIATYHARQKNNPPMPRLVVIIDEFAEMAKALPTFMDEINSIAAIGRSLGMHLILATQKPGGVVPDKVWANLKFRVCLRVATPADSRDMIGIPDAGLLPSSLPGRAYLRVGSDRLELFQSANIAYPYRPGSAAPEQRSAVVVRRVGLSSEDVQTETKKEEAPKAIAGRTELEVLVERVANASAPMPRWPNPLPHSITIEQAWHTYSITPRWKFNQAESRYTFQAQPNTLESRLKIAIGLVDDPHRQTQRPLWIDIKNQHYLIAGASRSGRSTLLQTIVRALMLNTSPEELHISLLDFGGQNLTVFKNAPHVANILNVNTPIHLRRFLGQIGLEVDQRSQMRANQRLQELPDVVYIIDGFAQLKELFPDEIDVLARVAREGISLGMHLIVTVDQLMVIPTKIRASILGRLALQQTDPSELMDLVGRFRGSLPDAVPGRGLVREEPSEPVLEFQIALPIGQQDENTGVYAPLLENDQFTELHKFHQALDTSWNGKRPEPIRILETLIPTREMPAAACPAGRTWGDVPVLPKLTIGKGDRRLSWIEIDFASHGPHFLIAGPPQSGKTNLLRSWVWNLCERYGPQQVRFTLVGLRNRSLNSLAMFPHVQQIIETEFHLDAALNALKEEATGRYQNLKKMVEADPKGNLEEMASTLGPVHFVIIDDYDTIRFTRDRQAKLLDFARYGRDTRTFLLLAGTSSDMLEFGDLMNYLKRGRAGFLLQAGEIETRVVEVRLSSASLRQEYPAGRGYLILGNRTELVQTIHLEEAYQAERCELFPVSRTECEQTAESL